MTDTAVSVEFQIVAKLGFRLRCKSPISALKSNGWKPSTTLSDRLIRA